jgi:lysyl-tRNA synthetase class 2
LEKPFARLSISEALSKYSGIELGQIQDLKTFQKIALKKHYSNASEYDWQTIFELIFANEIEPHIIPDKPCFLFDYPKQLCPLTKIKSGNSLVAEKVELYIGGKEIGNGYSEQTDWETQKLRFEDEKIARKAMNKKNVAFDSELIEALKHGMPEAAGMGLGIDRLAMILSNSQSINQVNLT